MLKDNNLNVDANSANFILKQTIREYFKDAGLPKERIRKIVEVINNTTEQLSKDNPSINFYPLVQGEGYQKYFNAMLDAVVDDNKKREIIDISKDIIKQAELKKQAETISKPIKKHINIPNSQNNAAMRMTKVKERGVVKQ